MKKEGFTPEQISFATSIFESDDAEMNKARDRFRELFPKFQEERRPEQEQVRELGGLCIIGTERHESRRIDNQLRGRSGRQGDPGTTQFFLSLDDELMRLFGGDRMRNLVSKMGLEDTDAIEAGMLTRTIENAQKKVEGKNFSIRRYVLQYDNVMNKQRETIYTERRRVLFGEDLREYIIGMAHELIDEAIEPIVFASKYPEEWDMKDMENRLKKVCDRFPGFGFTKDQLMGQDEVSIKEAAYEIFEDLYRQKEEEIGLERMREVERMILLRVVDNKWMDHIDAMDQLKNGIGLRAIGQQDPVVAYTNEGFDMFEMMIAAIREETVKYCYNVTINTRAERKQVIGAGEGRKDEYKDQAPIESAPVQNHQVPERDVKQETYRREQPKVGRNDPCPCGSGKKYKNCCGKNA